LLGTPGPAMCPQCGSKNTARVEWGHIPLAIDGVVAIAGGHRRPEGAPDSVCLNCRPEWSDIHLLALKEEEYQQAMEEFVAKADFEPARHWRDQRDSIRQQLQDQLRPLLGHTD
jgi:hypothetical protein